MVFGLFRLWFFEDDSSVFEIISGLCAAGTALKEQSYIDQAHQVILRKIFFCFNFNFINTVKPVLTTTSEEQQRLA
jgi:hypothetical protein